MSSVLVVEEFRIVRIVMSDVNLFSSTNDIKKTLFTTEKFSFNDQLSNDSWQDLSEVTITARQNNSQLDRCLVFPSTHQQSSHTKKNPTHKDSNTPIIEHTFPDSCESLTVSIDFHVPADELISNREQLYHHQDLVTPTNHRQKTPR